MSRHQSPPRVSAPSASGGPADGLPVPVDGSLGPAFEPIFHRWAIRAAHAERISLRSQVDQLSGQIAAMESSKFWKLRRTWFQLKRALGAAGTE